MIISNKGFLPDLTKFPDCEEKRQLQNLAQKFELHIRGMKDIDDNKEFERICKEANEIWWEMNGKMGALIAKVNYERKDNKRYILATILSIVALIISVIAILK